MARELLWLLATHVWATFKLLEYGGRTTMLRASQLQQVFCPHQSNACVPSTLPPPGLSNMVPAYQEHLPPLGLTEG